MPITKEVIVLHTDDGMGNSIGEIVGEVVRCKDCKWYNTTAHEKCVAYDAFWVTNPDDYCAWGERREDDPI